MVSENEKVTDGIANVLKQLGFIETSMLEYTKRLDDDLMIVISLWTNRINMSVETASLILKEKILNSPEASVEAMQDFLNEVCEELIDELDEDRQVIEDRMLRLAEFKMTCV